MLFRWFSLDHKVPAASTLSTSTLHLRAYSGLIALLFRRPVIKKPRFITGAFYLLSVAYGSTVQRVVQICAPAVMVTE